MLIFLNGSPKFIFIFNQISFNPHFLFIEKKSTKESLFYIRDCIKTDHFISGAALKYEKEPLENLVCYFFAICTTLITFRFVFPNLVISTNIYIKGIQKKKCKMQKNSQKLAKNKQRQIKTREINVRGFHLYFTHHTRTIRDVANEQLRKEYLIMENTATVYVVFKKYV